MVPDPVAGGEAEEDTAIQAALRAEVDVLDTRGVAETGDLEEPREAAVAAREALALEEQREAVLEGETGEIGHALLFFERVGHAGEAERVQEVERLLHQHGRVPEGEEAGEEDSGGSSARPGVR